MTSVCFNEDGHLLASRAMDDTVKLWDIRKFGGGVVKTFSDVPTHLVRNKIFGIRSLGSIQTQMPPIGMFKSCRIYTIQVFEAQYPPLLLGTTASHRGTVLRLYNTILKTGKVRNLHCVTFRSIAKSNLLPLFRLQNTCSICPYARRD